MKSYEAYESYDEFEDFVENNKPSNSKSNRIGFVTSLVIHVAFFAYLVSVSNEISDDMSGDDGMSFSLSALQTASSPPAVPSEKPRPKKRQKKQDQDVIPKPVESPYTIPDNKAPSRNKSAETGTKDTDGADEGATDGGEIGGTGTYGDGVYNIGMGGGGYSSIYGKIQRLINKYQIYPEILKRRSVQGTVIAEFVLYKNGRIADVKIIKASRNKEFNIASVRAIKDASRFFPKPDKNIRLQVLLKYELL